MRGVLRKGAWRIAPLVVVFAFASIPSPSSGSSESGNELEKRLAEVIDGPNYKHALWGALVANAATGETVFARNPDAMLAPASVTKLFTCAAALVAAGPDRTYETAVHRRGEVRDSILHGDLILVAGGDLTLGGRTRPDGKIAFTNHDHTYADSGLMESDLTDTDPLAGINALAQQVKAAGITQVDGDILVDDRLFDRTRGTGSGPEAVSAIMVNDNAVDLIVEPGAKPGDLAKVTTRPATAFFQLDALITTGEPGTGKELRLLSVGPNQFAIRGRVAADSKPAIRILPVDEPALFARTLFIESLRRNGVNANAALLRPVSHDLPTKAGYDQLPAVAKFTSVPLKDVVKVTLKVSHNLYASTLPCLVAVAKGQRTAEAGLREERKVLADLGVDAGAFSFGGGAGGAPADHVSARAVVQLLQGMAKRPEWEAYRDGLPVLGVDGTLADVASAGSAAKGKVHAKTGTLIWYDTANQRLLLKSKALAGTLTTKAGTPLHFALMVNNVPLPKGTTASREGKALARLCEILYEHGP